MAPKEPLTLYYLLTIPGTTENSDAAIEITTNINGKYSGSFVSNLLMCDADYKKFTKDIINFIGTRVPAKDSVGLSPMYLETVTIISKPYQSENSANMITATSNYIDSGNSPFTSTPSVVYTVTGASGKFAGYKYVKILYDNGKEKKRVVTLY